MEIGGQIKITGGTPDAGSYLTTDNSGLASWATIPGYTLPIATSSTLGGIKVGSGLSVNNSGILSNSYSYSLPIASSSTLGGVKVGSGLSIDGDGELSLNGFSIGDLSDATYGLGYDNLFFGFSSSVYKDWCLLSPSSHKKKGLNQVSPSRYLIWEFKSD